MRSVCNPISQIPLPNSLKTIYKIKATVKKHDGKANFAVWNLESQPLKGHKANSATVSLSQSVAHLHPLEVAVFFDSYKYFILAFFNNDPL